MTSAGICPDRVAARLDNPNFATLDCNNNDAGRRATSPAR